MDQQKIGSFIAQCRKKQNLTQSQLAEKLNITDRAVSKWETGRAMPDSSIMLELCNILKINVNDLLSGEIIAMNEYDKKHEELLLEMVKQKEKNDKRFLQLEILIGVLSIIILLSFTFAASFLEMEDWLRIVLIVIGFVFAIFGLMIALVIEQKAGYYQCEKCGHRYVPKFSNVLMSMHVNRTRYMKCPVCQKKSWQRKVISKQK